MFDNNPEYEPSEIFADVLANQRQAKRAFCCWPWDLHLSAEATDGHSHHTAEQGNSDMTVELMREAMEYKNEQGKDGLTSTSFNPTCANRIVS